MSGSCPPYQCPLCGRYLDFHLDYFVGSPHIHYTCKCGYDTANEISVTTTSTTPIESIDNVTPMPYYYTTNWNSVIKIK